MRTGTIHSTRHSTGGLALGAVIGLLAVASFQAWRAEAAPGDSDATYFPIPPCRLFDYRPAPATVGPRTSPLGPDETYTQQVTGSVGDCAIPSSADGVAMNVTIVLPTAASHLTIYPADVTTLPNASNLNWVAGQAATPNKVDVKLSPSGAINLHNHAGSVYVLADVVGYYSDASLDDLQARLASLESRPGPYVTEVAGSYISPVTLTSTAVKALTLPSFVPPANGTVVVTATAWMRSSPSGYDVYCAILPTTAAPGSDTLFTYPGAMMHETDGLSDDTSHSGTRTFAVTANVAVGYSLWCQAEPGASSGSVFTRNLVMTYLPT